MEPQQRIHPAAALCLGALLLFSVAAVGMMALFQADSRAAKSLHFTGYSVMAATVTALSTSFCIAACIIAVKRDPLFDGRRKIPVDPAVYV